METVASKTTKVAEDHLSLTAVNWVNHCTYTFKILQNGDSGMAVSIERNGDPIYAESIPYDTPCQVGSGNGSINGTLTATKTSLKFNGNLEESNLVLTNMTVGLI